MESKNLVDIPEYDNYKFDLDLLQVYNIKTNKYLKNHLCKSTHYYRICLSKNSKKKSFGIHQLVYLINNPTEDLTNFDIDHIDGNRLNNNIENLRKATRSENQCNTPQNKNNTSGYKNIYKSKYGYIFQLKKNGIRYNKHFKTLQETIDYRDKIVLEKCGEFGCVD